MKNRMSHLMHQIVVQMEQGNDRKHEFATRWGQQKGRSQWNISKSVNNKYSLSFKNITKLEILIPAVERVVGLSPWQMLWKHFVLVHHIIYKPKSWSRKIHNDISTAYIFTTHLRPYWLTPQIQTTSPNYAFLCQLNTYHFTNIHS